MTKFFIQINFLYLSVQVDSQVASQGNIYIYDKEN